MIIGLSGKMKSGKTTVAEYIKSQLPETNVMVWGFGHEVKLEFLRSNATLYNISDLDKQEVKDERGDFIVCGVRYDDITVREALCKLGIKRREQNPDYWVHKWQETVASAPDNFIIIAPDVRFPNEVKAIQDMGGIVIRLTRNPVDSQDETETALDNTGCYLTLGSGSVDNKELYFNHVVDNRFADIDETNKAVYDIVKERNRNE